MAGTTSGASARTVKIGTKATQAGKEDAAAPARKPARMAAPRRRRPTAAAKPQLLSGGNPQIAKAEGDAPVQAWIAAKKGSG